jgi:hypothetical protein
VSELSTPYVLRCVMRYEQPDDERLPTVGFMPNIWIEGAGDQFLLGRIDEIETSAGALEHPFTLSLTVIGVEELALGTKPGAKVRLFRGGWAAPWLTGESLTLARK